MTAGAPLGPRFWYRALRARWRDQKAEIAALVGALREGDAAADVGANKGSYLPWLSRAVGPSGRVVAFEPQPALADYLSRACRAAGLANVVVEAVGASDASGTRTLRVPGTGGSSPGASFERDAADPRPASEIAVPVVSLDEYFRAEPRRVGAIKVDVEGHELAVLRGAEKTLSRHGPLVVFECEIRHVGHDGLRAALDFFAARGYRGAFVRGGRLAPLEEFDPAIHQQASGDRFWDAPGYCNNFVMSRRAG